MVGLGTAPRWSRPERPLTSLRWCQIVNVTVKRVARVTLRLNEESGHGLRDRRRRGRHVHRCGARRRVGVGGRGQGPVDAAGLLARGARRARAARRAAGPSRRGDARRDAPHRPRHDVVAERAGDPPGARRRVPDHAGAPRLDLHHERRGPLPRALAARAPARARAGQGPLPAPEAPRPRGRRAARPRRRGRRRARRGRGARADPHAAGRRRAGDRGVAAVVVPQPGARAPHPRARARDRPGRVRRALQRGQPAHPRVRAQLDHHHEHAGRSRVARLPRPRWSPRCASAVSPARCW